MFVRITFDTGDSIIGDAEEVSPAQLLGHLGRDAIVVLLSASILDDDGSFVAMSSRAAAVHLLTAVQIDFLDA